MPSNRCQSSVTFLEWPPNHKEWSLPGKKLRMSTLEEKNESRRRSRRSAGIACAVFLSAILILAFLGNSQIILVVLLYACLVLAGVSLAVFSWHSKSGYEEDLEMDVKKDERIVTGNDVVSSMDTYVKYASRGSEHSRREIAHVINNVMSENRSKRRDLSDDALLQSDLKRVVFQFIEGDQPTRTNFSGRESRSRVSSQEREVYLASLERIVQKLAGL